jgi:hypothetical protein
MRPLTSFTSRTNPFRYHKLGGNHRSRHLTLLSGRYYVWVRDQQIDAVLYLKSIQRLSAANCIPVLANFLVPKEFVDILTFLETNKPVTSAYSCSPEQIFKVLLLNETRQVWLSVHHTVNDFYAEVFRAKFYMHTEE